MERVGRWSLWKVVNMVMGDRHAKFDGNRPMESESEMGCKILSQQTNRHTNIVIRLNKLCNKIM